MNQPEPAKFTFTDARSRLRSSVSTAAELAAASAPDEAPKSRETGSAPSDAARVTAAVTGPRRLLPPGSSERKEFPLARGLLDYFPDALAAVAQVSYIGNLKHNPGQALHWARGKSMDHDDCIVRHTIERGGYEEVTVDGKMYRIRHSAARAWRALAALQEELEAVYALDTPRNARDAR